MNIEYLGASYVSDTWQVVQAEPINHSVTKIFKSCKAGNLQWGWFTGRGCTARGETNGQGVTD